MRNYRQSDAVKPVDLELTLNRELLPIVDTVVNGHSVLLNVTHQSTEGKIQATQVLFDPRDSHIFIHSQALEPKTGQVFPASNENDLTVLLKTQEILFDIVRASRQQNDRISLPDEEVGFHYSLSEKEFNQYLSRRDPETVFSIQLDDTDTTSDSIAAFIASHDGVFQQPQITIRDHARTLLQKLRESEGRVEVLQKPQERPIRIELSRANFHHNLREIRRVTGGMKMILMVKANGYGHGAVEIAKMAEEFGAEYLGVVCIAEARTLRDAGIKTPIMIFSDILPADAAEAIALDATITVSNTKVLEAVNKAAKQRGPDYKAKIQIHIDTGMFREGIWPPSEGVRLAAMAQDYPNIELDGIFTHFANSDDKKPLPFTAVQLERFNQCLDAIVAMGIPLPPYIHTANSGGVLQVPEAHSQDPYRRITATRPGIVAYGLSAGDEVEYPFEPIPVLSLKANLVNRKVVPKGHTVGYAQTWTAPVDTPVGIITVGYADGLRRVFSNIGEVLIGRRRAHVRGRVSMDNAIFEIPDGIDPRLGDEVVIIGRQGSEQIRIEDWARILKTNTNEAAIAFNNFRLPRVIVD